MPRPPLAADDGSRRLAAEGPEMNAFIHTSGTDLVDLLSRYAENCKFANCAPDAEYLQSLNLTVP